MSDPCRDIPGGPANEARPTNETPGLWRQIKADISCVFARDPAASSRFEILTTYPGVHAVIAHRLAHGLWRRGWCYAARLMAFLSRMVTHIEIHPAAVIGQRFFIDHGAGVVIGETARVGDDVTLYHGVTLGGTSWSKGKRHPTLGDGVIIGSGAVVLGPVTIGAHAKVGANSVVIDDVPEGRTAVGVPGRVVRRRGVEHLNPSGIDLNHHLIADPVADAMACILERLGQLEARFPPGDVEPECAECDGPALCAHDLPRRRKARLEAVEMDAVKVETTKMAVRG
ncbi:serine O-acetyltransferase [Varunaivibrio sulfuroxidans]|uniref:serine O-acetyltransferase n=1 Tax=Varunaivibrio sulfuroxidans TaxID=1773489 RepID=A0A4R3J9R9_9PROT|nr:serine O-acetyltransferase [Varunaivibrio sulfuroxidans]TCS61766.1 serine O-acetyltransferase [Varunaivibrio sulfuroxidans]WES32050.1 serine O-acetyltransferase [Varunaivibrio sulfuroxidans]